MLPAGPRDPTSPSPTNAATQALTTSVLPSQFYVSQSAEPLTYHRTSSRPSPTRFELLCEIAQLPPSGIELFEARRTLWLTPPSVGDPTPTIAPNADSGPPVSNSARTKLEDLLSRPGALESDEVWEVGLSKVWRGLVGGGRLKKALPLNLVVRCLPALLSFIFASL